MIRGVFIDFCAVFRKSAVSLEVVNLDNDQYLRQPSHEDSQAPVPIQSLHAGLRLQ